MAPIEMLYDVHARERGQHLLMLPFFNYAERNHDAIREMLLHPGGVSGCPTAVRTADSSATRRSRRSCSRTGHATRTRGHAAARVPGQEADLRHGGALRPGRPRRPRPGHEGRRERHRLRRPDPADAAPGSDLPAGGRRLLQEADGYVATMVSGEITRRHGVDTGARPGRLLRGARYFRDPRHRPFLRHSGSYDAQL